MKYTCDKEFDLNEIYRKLTSPSKPYMVKASEFFTPLVTLSEFQQAMKTTIATMQLEKRN